MRLQQSREQQCFACAELTGEQLTLREKEAASLSSTPWAVPLSTEQMKEPQGSAMEDLTKDNLEQSVGMLQREKVSRLQTYSTTRFLTSLPTAATMAMLYLAVV